jgi:ArsR family transcriptional regulator, arsenate/arsenite/antimonite-responsive transcriptional repressor
MEQSKALAALQALSHPARLDLVRLLVPEGETGLCAGDIAGRLGLSASRLSFHLSALEGAGLLQSRKVARHVIYRVDPIGMGQTISWLLSDCCRDHPAVHACCTNRATAAPETGPEISLRLES